MATLHLQQYLEKQQQQNIFKWIYQTSKLSLSLKSFELFELILITVFWEYFVTVECATALIDVELLCHQFLLTDFFLYNATTITPCCSVKGYQYIKRTDTIK